MNLIRQWVRGFFRCSSSFVSCCWFVYLTLIQMRFQLNLYSQPNVYLFIYYVSIAILLSSSSSYTFISLSVFFLFLWRISVIWLNRFKHKVLTVCRMGWKADAEIFGENNTYFDFPRHQAHTYTHSHVLLNSLAIQVSAWWFAYAVFRAVESFIYVLNPFMMRWRKWNHYNCSIESAAPLHRRMHTKTHAPTLQCTIPLKYSFITIRRENVVDLLLHSF